MDYKKLLILFALAVANFVAMIAKTKMQLPDETMAGFGAMTTLIAGFLMPPKATT